MSKKEAIGGRIEPELYREVQRLSNEKGITQSRVIEGLIAQALGEDELVLNERTNVENGVDKLNEAIDGNSGISKKIDRLNEKLDGLSFEGVKEGKNENKIVIDGSRLKRDSTTDLFQDCPEILDYMSDLEAIGSLEGKVDWLKIVGEESGSEEDEEDLALIKDIEVSQEEFEKSILPFFEEKFGYSVDSWPEARSALLDEGYNIIGVNSYDSDYFIGFYKSILKKWEKIEGV